MTTCVFDTGALIALERRDLRMSQRVLRLRESKAAIVVPTAVLGEWWRGRSDWRDTILAAMVVEPLDAPLAKVAGEAIARVRGATLVDAVVMASAARHGAVVYTSDVDDLGRLGTHFRTVRVLSVSLAERSIIRSHPGPVGTDRHTVPPSVVCPVSGQSSLFPLDRNPIRVHF